ncbi:MAG: hypothetical protein JWP65_1427 [Ramlibacter sp.]|jgi:hypothetical protein|uniref:hypothetical protein n=1 Tax=Ramlibacter sp. TaxID=1917967 RepID=UPI002626897C|nr:hypothetical protein [Ramlibacter sp.]MDB5751006.1 hypothetical protein [Ramlibacter sp.]
MMQKPLAMLAFATLLAAAPSAGTMPVPSSPGSICRTPQLVCRLAPPARPGSPCSCPSPYGRLNGLVE